VIILRTFRGSPDPCNLISKYEISRSDEDFWIALYGNKNNPLSNKWTDLYVCVQSQMDDGHGHGDRRRVVAFEEKRVYFLADIFVGHHVGVFFWDFDQKVQKRIHPFPSYNVYIYNYYTNVTTVNRTLLWNVF